MAEQIETNVVLEGGPSDLPESARRRRIAAKDSKIKIEHCGGYEHFERTETGTFRWTTRTKIAE